VATDPVAVARWLVDAFNAADWVRLRAGLADEVAYEEPGTGRRAVGLEACVALCRARKAACPDATGTVRRAATAGGTAALEMTWRGTPAGPLAASSGGPTMAATLWVTVGDGRATAVRLYLNNRTATASAAGPGGRST
jgi:SnoaL-like domain